MASGIDESREDIATFSYLGRHFQFVRAVGLWRTSGDSTEYRTLHESIAGAGLPPAKRLVLPDLDVLNGITGEGIDCFVRNWCWQSDAIFQID